MNEGTLTQPDVSFIGSLLPMAGVMFLISVGVILLYQQFRKNLYKRELEQRTLEGKHQNELLRASLEAQEEERTRIAKDMHDELGAVLSIARMQVIQIERQTNDQDLKTNLQEIKETAESALSSMRRLTHQLMPPLLDDFGMIKALESVVEKIKNSSELLIVLIVPDNFPRTSRVTELAIYRIAMELINNTLKHAKATRAQLVFSATNSHIFFLYKDDGIGLPKEYTPGLGLRNIEARINAVNGKIDIGGERSKGFYADIEIPM
jgi:signal transduction histidine kinase